MPLILLDKIPPWSETKIAVATALLPNVFGALLFRDLVSLVNARNSVLLHARQDVTVEVERDPNFAVAQPLTRHLRMHTCGQHVRRMRVPKVVELNTREMGGAGGPHLREATRLHRLSVLASVDKRRVGLPHAKSQQFFSLGKAMLAQLGCNHCRKRDRAAPTRFRRLVPDPRVRLFRTLHYRDFARSKIDVAPSQRDYLPSPQPARNACLRRRSHLRA